MTLVVIVVLIVFIVSFVTVTLFSTLSAVRQVDIGGSRSYLLLVPSQARLIGKIRRIASELGRRSEMF
jgi:hypothetical protein